MRPILFLPLVALLAAPAGAVTPTRAPSDATLYVRARVAEAAGDAGAASADLATLLARDPDDMAIAQRAYRQALTSGDMTLALRTARRLDSAGELPADGRLLLALDALRSKDWAGVRAAADALEKERLFGFLALYLRGWAAQGARSGDPLAIIDPAREQQLARAYFAEQRMLILLAQGKMPEALAQFRSEEKAQSGPARLRLADALAGAGKRDEALALLAGQDPAFAAARTALGAGKRLPDADSDAATAVSMLLTRIAGDFARQRLTPVALVIARLATFAAPGNGTSWLVTGELLAGLKRSEAALTALGRIQAGDPVAPLAAGLRIGVLTGTGRAEEALKEARAAAERTPTALTWSRVGDIEMTRDRHGAAADAYDKAIAAADAAKSDTPAVTWPLLLQLGAARDLAGDWPAARGALERAYVIAPEEPLVLNQYGYSQIARRENVAQASRLIEKASALRPDDAAITDSLGWANYLRGRPEAAVPLLEKAAEGDPAQSEISEHLGDAYWTVGRRYEARFAWRAALVTADDKHKARLAAKVDHGLTPETAAP
jgi:tetratricopeptide (TPR) repeat protein